MKVICGLKEKEKVYCSECDYFIPLNGDMKKYIITGDYVPFYMLRDKDQCRHESNRKGAVTTKGSYKDRPRVFIGYVDHPSTINKNNDCEWFRVDRWDEQSLGGKILL